MNWFYAKDGQQIGPVEFSEIERLRAEGQLTDDTLVWQQGMANWVKLSTVSRAAVEKAAVEVPADSTLPPIAPQPLSNGPTPVPDYGDMLCWGIIGILLPCRVLPSTSRLSSCTSLNSALSAKRLLPVVSRKQNTARFIRRCLFSD